MPIIKTMRASGWAKIGYMLSDGDSHAPYYREAIEHFGLTAELVQNLQELTAFDVVLLCGYSETGPPPQAFVDWLAQGGVAVVSSGSWGLESALGWSSAPQHFSNSLMTPTGDSVWPDETPQIRFFGGSIPKKVAADQTFAEVEGSPAAYSRKIGEGAIFYLGVNVGQTVSLMQLGRAVECDGIGPSDSSVRLDDGHLRSEDGIALSFEHDRVGTFFGYAHADAVKELYLRIVLKAIETTGLRTVMSWIWPDNATGAALLTLDCDDPEFDHAVRLQRMLTMFGCPACWVVPMPGYRADSYRQIRAWDHEVGVLFQTDDSTGWHSERFHIQFTATSRLSSMNSILTARPAGGRWRGLYNFYDMCQETGARVSLSKGGRQAGTAGFAFGTCHPFFPIKRDGHSYFVMEVPYCAFDPGETLSDEVSDALLAQVSARHGCFHLVFRPESINNPVCSAALRRTLSLCKQRRLEFTTPRDMHAFEVARRRIRVQTKKIGDDMLLQASSDVALNDITLLVTGDPVDAELRGKEVNVTPVTRFGVRFHAITISLPPKQQVELILHERLAQSQAA